jgi:hypothetical protein
MVRQAHHRQAQGKLVAGFGSGGKSKIKNQNAKIQVKYQKELRQITLISAD